MSQFFTSGGQNIRASASASVFPMNIQDWFPLGLTGLIFLQAKRLSRVSSNTTVQKHQFFGTQLSLFSLCICLNINSLYIYLKIPSLYKLYIYNFSLYKNSMYIYKLYILYINYLYIYKYKLYMYKFFLCPYTYLCFCMHYICMCV